MIIRSDNARRVERIWWVEEWLVMVDFVEKIFVIINIYIY
jgi:hypothetical protein